MACWLLRGRIWRRPDTNSLTKAIKKPSGKPRGFFSITFRKFGLDDMGSFLTIWSDRSAKIMRMSPVRKAYNVLAFTHYLEELQVIEQS